MMPRCPYLSLRHSLSHSRLPQRNAVRFAPSVDPVTTISLLLAHLSVAQAADSCIVEIGAGTGKFTELAEREEGFEIVAVEPHEEMRRCLLGKDLRGVTVVDDDARNVPVEDGWGNACVAAQVGLDLE
jgi:tRNA G46 methylase TrmB